MTENNALLVIGLFIILIYVIYKLNTKEEFVQIDNSTSLNDCLSICSADIKCNSAEYDEKKKTCKVSKTNDELLFGNVYVKKDRFVDSNTYYDPDLKEYVFEQPLFSVKPI